MNNVNCIQNENGVKKVISNSSDYSVQFALVISGSKVLMELVNSLASDTGQSLSELKYFGITQSPSTKQGNPQLPETRHTLKPLSEEDLLKKPFYTIEEPNSNLQDQNFPQGTFQLTYMLFRTI